MKALIERLNALEEMGNEHDVLCMEVSKLYKEWVPETEEGKLYKEQLGDVLERVHVDSDHDY